MSISYPVSREARIQRLAAPIDLGLCVSAVPGLRSPERFLDSLRASRVSDGAVKVIISTGNIGFFVTRFALMLGWFNYGSRGILDLTHARLFTFKTARALFEQSGYRVEEVKGVPAPFPLAFGYGLFGKLCLAINKALIRISKGLFAYQIFMVCTPLPSVPWLLARAHETRAKKIEDRATAS